MRIRVSPLSVSTSLCVIYAVIALIGLLSDTESAQFKFYVLTHGWIHEYLKNIEFLWSYSISYNIASHILNRANHKEDQQGNLT